MLATVRNGYTFTPFDRLSQLRSEMDRLFEGLWPENRLQGSATWVPPMDVIETDEEIRCLIEVPGLSHEDLDITVERNVVTVSGEKKLERQDNQPESNYRIFERRYGRFSRSILLPDNVQADRVAAHYENGVLTLVFPKTEESKPRRIQVQATGTSHQLKAGS